MSERMFFRLISDLTVLLTEKLIATSIDTVNFKQLKIRSIIGILTDFGYHL